MEKHICIHGHFYQPPRENPWLENIELQDSSYPYHDWNERIAAECYETNAASRILNEDGWIKRIVNNYAKISFNFGPTLLSWMESNGPDIYKAIIEADHVSIHNHSGHGSALAQTYNHMIMPLANAKDKYTQVLWGIKDFETRFGRRPEGMWLPETAVDLNTLEILAEQGISFTVLAPYQAKRIRRIGDDGYWEEIGTRGIDSTMPYLINLPGTGRSISVFFYNGDISRAVAFEKLLFNGERFARRLLSAFREEKDSPQIINIATDGETYGHHHRYGEMALAYALFYIESNKLARITSYGEYLEKYPPYFEVEINDNSSWSCAHGVERWRNNCGCNSGLHPGWSQSWRAPLRNALNWLRNTLSDQFENEARLYLKDPWAARNEYISIILDRSPDSLNSFLEIQAAKELNIEEQVTVIKLLEMQRHAMLMFTSCGWFFDEISGIETVQVLQYAGRVIQLARELFNIDLEPEFLEMLAKAKSNIKEYQDGAQIYEKFVKPSMVDLLKVGAHYAICSLFETYDEHSRIYCYEVLREDNRCRLAGSSRLIIGRARVTSEITRESVLLNYGAVNFGNQNVNAGVGITNSEEAYQEMIQEVTEAFDRVDSPEVIRLFNRYFEGTTYSLKQLFRDKQRKVLDQILNTTLAEIAADYRHIYERHAPLMLFLKDLNIPQPKVLYTATEFVLNTSLRYALAEDEPDLERIKAILNEAKIFKVPLDGTSLGYIIKKSLEKMGERLYKNPEDISQIKRLDSFIGLILTLPFEVDLWKIQNIYYEMLQRNYPELKAKEIQGDESLRTWIAHFESLGDKLKVKRDK
ncbi:MAG: Glycoside hydrolase, family 57 [Desulfotomaculum sp. 46_296]|nr:MAG: Glycoside hydrolase, family 57 [Desulfotomaculum sp. 46_296]HAU32458.1 glycoside hydrolase [Desulfotomaculum sp.]